MEEIIDFDNSQWMASKLVSIKINNGGTLVGSDILNKNYVLWSAKSMFLLKTTNFITAAGLVV